MLSHDRVGAMRYPAPFAFTPDAREGRPYGVHHRAPESLREFLGLQGARLQPVRYPLTRDHGARDNVNAAGIGGILRGRGRGRGRVESTDIGGILRGRGDPDDIAGELRGRGGRAGDIAAGLRGRGQAAEVTAELRARVRAAELAAELREQLPRPRREPCHDHPHNSDRQSNWLYDFPARHRAAQRPAFHELLEDYARRRDSDHGHHTGHHDHHHGHGCHQRKKSCGCGDADHLEKKEYSFKTKDVTLRGKSYQIRKSFLADLGKFENELIKFVDKKSDEELPERVIQLLVDFINEESCESDTALDLVGLNILSSNLGYKSAVESSLQQLKKLDEKYYFSADELTKICGTITMSGKVDEGLESWLKKFLRNHDAFHVLESSRSFRVLIASHPEVGTRLETLMGWRDNENQLGLMIM